ncbi:hypothetical protein DF135_10280 [Burkholderia cepacia]|nr:hypothetical protein [Burkholderia sp. HAN2018]RQT38855.1 hypothetical protein DF135_10280 [Burkholderia cepacia]
MPARRSAAARCRRSAAQRPAASSATRSASKRRRSAPRQSARRRFRGAEAPFSHAAPQRGRQPCGNDPLPFCTPCHRRAA